jgi:hypothetical protein
MEVMRKGRAISPVGLVSLTLFMSLFASVAGCSCRSGVDLASEQPWIGGPTSAVPVTQICYGPGSGRLWQFTWQHPTQDESVDAEATAIKVDKYLSTRGLDRTVQRVDLGQVTDAEVIGDAFFLLDRGFLFQHTVVIVAVHPTVVLLVPHPSLVGSLAFRVKPDSSGNNDGMWAILPEGIGYGNSVPYSPDVLWFDPATEVPPRSPEWRSSEEGWIEMPWGRLVLRREGGRWQVHATGPNS